MLLVDTCYLCSCLCHSPPGPGLLSGSAPLPWPCSCLLCSSPLPCLRSVPLDYLSHILLLAATPHTCHPTCPFRFPTCWHLYSQRPNPPTPFTTGPAAQHVGTLNISPDSKPSLSQWPWLCLPHPQTAYPWPPLNLDLEAWSGPSGCRGLAVFFNDLSIAPPQNWWAFFFPCPSMNML